MTGMFLDIPELSGKQVGLLEEIVPRLSRIAIFGILGLNALQFAATETAARALALEAEFMEVRTADDLVRALETARTKHVEAGVLLSSPLAYASSKQISELAIAQRLPLISFFVEFPKVGGFIAYGPNQQTSSEDAGITSLKSCMVPSRVTCRYSGRRGSIWRSTSRPPKR
jgi:putative ABC transport system substrate-binding protein